MHYPTCAGLAWALIIKGLGLECVPESILLYAYCLQQSFCLFPSD